MVSDELREIVNNLYELSEHMEEYVDMNDASISLTETAKSELLEFLCRLALADEAVVMAEIKFINTLFETSYNLLDIKKMGREYDDTGAYVVPAIIEKSCEFDTSNQYADLNAAQTVVNAFYFVGIEFVACDDEVASSEIKMLTEFIGNYQAYLSETGVGGEAYNVVEDLRARNYLKRKGDDNLIVPQKMPTENVNIYGTETKVNSLIAEIEKEKYEKVRKKLMTLINHIRIRHLRASRGLKNPDLPKTMVLFGGKTKEVEGVADLIAEIFNLEGITEEKFVTRYTCTDYSSEEQIEKTLELARQGNMLIMNADQLSKSETEKIMNAVKRNEHQAILLSGDMNRLISFLEKNRTINSEFSRSFYLDNINEEIICDIFEYLCVENDYLASEGAKEFIKNYFKVNIGKFDPYYIFEIFDRSVRCQNQRILSETDLDSTKMVTINAKDVENGCI